MFFLSSTVNISCKKDDTLDKDITTISNQPISSEIKLTDDISMMNGRLKFSSIQAYSNFIERRDLNEVMNLKQLLSANNFKPFSSHVNEDYPNITSNNSNNENLPNIKKSSSDSTYEEEPFMEMDTMAMYEENLLYELLTTEGLIQIGDWHFKLNFESELVFALNDNNIEYYEDLLAEDDDHDYITVYSFEDEVLEMIEYGEYKSGAAVARCKDDKAPAKSKHEHSNQVGEGATMNFEVRYRAMGIYFRLFGRAWPTPSSARYWMQFTGGRNNNMGAVAYEPRCKSLVEYTTHGFGTKGPQQRTMTHYSSTRALKKYYLGMRVWDTWNPPARIITGWMIIRHGL